MWISDKNQPVTLININYCRRETGTGISVFFMLRMIQGLQNKKTSGYPEVWYL